MRNRHNKRQSPSRVAQEQLLQVLLRQYEEISEEIIALVGKTSSETERLTQTLGKKSKGKLLEFPDLRPQTQKRKLLQG